MLPVGTSPLCNNACRVAAGKYLQPMQGYWISPRETLVLSVDDGPTDGGPSQPTAYQLGRCWLLFRAWASLCDVYSLKMALGRDFRLDGVLKAWWKGRVCDERSGEDINSDWLQWSLRVLKKVAFLLLRHSQSGCVFALRVMMWKSPGHDCLVISFILVHNADV